MKCRWNPYFRWFDSFFTHVWYVAVEKCGGSPCVIYLQLNLYYSLCFSHVIVVVISDSTYPFLYVIRNKKFKRFVSSAFGTKMFIFCPFPTLFPSLSPLKCGTERIFSNKFHLSIWSTRRRNIFQNFTYDYYDQLRQWISWLSKGSNIQMVNEMKIKISRKIGVICSTGYDEISK